MKVDADRPAAPLRLGLDGDLAERVLQPVVENACRYGTSWARVSLTRSGSKIVYVVEDDGPGVAAQEQESIFEPGSRGFAGARRQDGGRRPRARARAEARSDGFGRRDRSYDRGRRLLRGHAALRLIGRPGLGVPADEQQRRETKRGGERAMPPALFRVIAPEYARRG